MAAAAQQHRVVVIGGGFGGLKATTSLRSPQISVTLLDRRNFHLFQPLLYQVATGGLSPANIATPLRSLLRRQTNCEVLMADVKDVDLQNREVILEDGRVPYDSLIVAAGAKHSYFGNDQWEPFAPGLKTIEDATHIRARVLSAFEKAEKTDDPQERQRLLTFVVVGAGPTGVELAGALSEIARHTMRRDFRRINTRDARVLLIEGGPNVLPVFSPELSEKAVQALNKLGVIVRRSTSVIDVSEHSVTLKSGENTEVLPAATILWAAGVRGESLGGILARHSGAETDRAGRVIVQPDFSLPGHPEVFVIGDLSSYKQPDGKPLPGVAPAAMQAGAFVAKLILARLNGSPLPTFAFKDPGSMATIGRGHAVVSMGKWKFSGYFAWLTWLFVHLMFLVQFQNRILVLMQWAWNYVTFNRAARLITEAPQVSAKPLQQGDA